MDAGRQGEAAAARYLESLGWRILARGWRVRGGELDLVAADGSLLVFVEVKTRGAGAWDDGRGAVGAAKRRRLRRAAGLFLARHGLGHRPCRFDVVMVRREAVCRVVEHLKGAFEG